MPTRTALERRLIDSLPERDADVHCNARIVRTDDDGTKYAAYCARDAGWGTEKSYGRCKLHGGASDGRPVTQALYSKHLTEGLQDRAIEIANSHNMVGLVEEILVIKTMFTNLMEHLKEEMEKYSMEGGGENIWVGENRHGERVVAPEAKVLMDMVKSISTVYGKIIDGETKLQNTLSIRSVSAVLAQIEHNVLKHCAGCPVMKSLRTGLSGVKIRKEE